MSDFLGDMRREREERHAADAERFAALDGDECQLCGAYGADKRSLVVRYFYAIHEMVPEAIDLSAVPEDHDLYGRGYYLRTCKTCRGDFLAMLRAWRDRRVSRRPIPKDHDGYEDDAEEGGMIPVRREGRVVWMTPEQYEAVGS